MEFWRAAVTLYSIHNVLGERDLSPPAGVKEEAGLEAGHPMEIQKNFRCKHSVDQFLCQFSAVNNWQRTFISSDSSAILAD